MRRRSAVLSVLAALAVATADAAAVTVPLRDDIAAGPAFAGGQVVWAETRTRSGRARAVLRTRRGTARLPSPTPVRGLTVDEERPELLLGSPTHAALVRGYSRCGRDVCSLNPFDVLAGPAAGPPAIVRSRRTCVPGPIAPESVDLAGSVLAFADLFLDCPRSDRAARVVVRDLAGGSERVIARSRGPVQVRIAGRLVAYERARRRGEVIRVFDLDRGRVVRRIESARLRTDSFSEWDLAADGTVAVAYRPPGATAARLAWWPARGGGPRRLRLPPPSFDEDEPRLQLAGGRIAYLAEVSERRYSAWVNLVVAPLRGGPLRIVRFSPRRRRFGQVAFDGRRLAWAEQRVDREKLRCPGPSDTVPCFVTPLGPRQIVVRRL